MRPSSRLPALAIVAYNAGSGAQVWVARHGDPAKGPSYGVSAAASPAGQRSSSRATAPQGVARVGH
jgi:exo-beta-1,3-glucanase (GH17 family)